MVKDCCFTLGPNICMFYVPGVQMTLVLVGKKHIAFGGSTFKKERFFLGAPGMQSESFSGIASFTPQKFFTN